MADARPGRRLALPLAALAALAAVAPAAGGAPAQPPPRVTVIGDSVATAMAYDATAKATLGQGIDLQLQVTPCRRVEQSSCPYDGVRPPTVVDVVHALGTQLGPTVVVAVGYNDFEQAYAGDIEDTLAALQQVGVTRVLWLTLRADRHSYLSMNDDIRAAAAKHPQLTVVDWNLYSRSHPDWFQPDGLHLAGAGAQAMAKLVHDALAELGIPLPPPPAPRPLGVASARLVAARVGDTYAARLVARGGSRPYRWSRAAGVLPRGLRLTRDGRLLGVPARSGSFSLVVRVVDGRHAVATRRLALRVRA